MTHNNNPKEIQKKQKTRIFFGFLGGLLAICVLVYFLWFRLTISEPISEQLSLPPETGKEQTGVDQEKPDQSPSNLPEMPVFTRPTQKTNTKPVCGDDAEWIVLLVGIDYRGDGYLYGLADIIRMVRIDFIHMTANLISLPRDLLVETPEGRFTAPGPFKLNQAYLFGTPGMGHYLGTGDGAGALAEVIRFNFGIPIDHYGVVNFNTFVDFIDAIGGIEVDLPGPVYDEYIGSFPAGLQTLDGRSALSLARIRRGYYETFRVNHQTLILRAILKKMIQPNMLLKIPNLVNEFADGFLTDLSIQQLSSLGICSLRKFDISDLKSFDPPQELLVGDHVFIPTLDNESFVYRWDQNLVDWMYNSLLEE